MEGLWAIDSSEEDDYYLVQSIPAMAATKALHYEAALLVQGEYTNPNWKDNPYFQQLFM